MRVSRTYLFALATAAIVILPGSVLACGSCYGAADSSATNGLNYAILSMIGVTGGVLTGITSFYFYLRKRAKAYLATNDTQQSTHDDGGLY